MIHVLSLVVSAKERKSKKDDKCSISASTSSRISTAEIRNIVDKLSRLRHRDSTCANYYSVWKVFSKFCLHLDIKPKSWQDRLTLFVGYLVDEGKQSSTVKSYISAIKDVLKDDGSDIKKNTFFDFVLDEGL